MLYSKAQSIKNSAKVLQICYPLRVPGAKRVSSIETQVRKEFVLSVEANEALNALKTKKQRAFCLYMLVYNNKSKAAEEAGFTPRSAPTVGCNLYKEVKVRACIDALRACIADSLCLKAQDVIERLNDIGKGDITDVVEWDKDKVIAIRPSKTLPKSVTRAIKSIDCKPIVASDAEGSSYIIDHHFKITMHDSIRANQLCGEHLGMFSDFNKAVQALSQYGEVEPTPNGFVFKRTDAVDVESEEVA